VNTLWDADLGIPSCDGIDLTGKTLGDTIACPNSFCGSSNPLFQLSACLANSDSLDGFPLDDLAGLIADMQYACAEGGSELDDLVQTCAAANKDDGIYIMCPLN